MLREDFNIANAHFKLRGDVLFNPKKHDINELQAKKENQIRVVDDGYFLGMNLDFNVELAKESVKVAMGTRSKHNCVIFNFQRPTRATKGLLERFKIMFFKPTKRDTILLARSSLTVLSEDPWDLSSILKGKNDFERMKALKHNHNYITSFTTKALPHRIYDKYKKLQAESLEARRIEKSTAEDIDSAFVQLSKEIYDRVKRGNLAYVRLDEEFMRIFGNATQAKAMKRFYEKWEMSQKIQEAASARGMSKRDAALAVKSEKPEALPNV